MPYDRYALAGGLDTATPYLNRQPGTLLSCRNFFPDTDGGYRIASGYERFDGHPSPSQAIVYNLHMASPITTLLPGDTITGSISGAVATVGLITGNQLWVDVTSTAVMQEGDLISGVAIEYITIEHVDYRNFSANTATVSILVVDPDGPFAITAGGRVRGVITGAQAIVNYVKQNRNDFWLYCTMLEGQLQPGEDVQAEASGNVAVLVKQTDVEPMLSNPQTPASVWYYLSENRRQKIGQVPGVGDVRGVWELEGVVYAFRDKSATEGGMYRSTATGWQAVSLGKTLMWGSRPSTVTDDFFLPGDVLKGATSNATITMGWVGYSDQNHKAGYVSGKTSTGTFTVGENIVNTSQGNTVVGVVTAVLKTNTLPPGGTYRFANHNFYGGSDSFAMFGVNGIGAGMAFSESRGLTFVQTGRAVENPFDVVVYKDHLFFAYPHGSLQHSAVGSPLDWSGGLGALEVGVGSEISSLIPAPKALIICTVKDIQALEGDGVYNWNKEVITSHTGISKYTGLYQSQSLVLAQAGIVALDRTDQFGNFSDSVLSDRIRDLLVPLFSSCTGALARKDRGQYLLYFEGGVNISLSTNQGQVTGFAQFDHGGLVVRMAVNPYGRIFFVSDSGYVYQDDAGTSNDGEERVALFRTSYANQGDPDTRKRYRRVDVTLSSTSFVNLLLNFSYDKGANDAQFSLDSGILTSRGGRWDTATWNNVFWDSSEYPTVSSDIDGIGFDIGVMAYISSRIQPAFIIEDIAMEWSPRRKVR